MNAMPIKIKIKDIAEKAGVSAGTVDRVLHNRGNVSKETKKKVLEILEQIHYTPNLSASALASKKTFVFYSVIPNCEPGGYWKMVEVGLRRAEQELSDFKVLLKINYFDQYDSASFIRAMDETLKNAPDGILFPPFQKQITLDYTRQMEELGIPYVFIDSKIEGARPLAYYGQDSFQSGYLGAKLLFTQKPDLHKIAVFSFFHSGEMHSNQVSLRMEGFQSYVGKFKKDCELVRVPLDAYEWDQNERIMENLFSENPDVEGAVLFSSRSYVIADFLEKHHHHVTLIGYDLLEKNVACLRKNTIAYLIAQRPEEQAYRGIKAFSDSLIFKKQIQPINFAPIDILTQENIDFYLKF